MKVNSSFWLEDFMEDERLTDSFNENEKRNYDLYKLSSSKKAISNFVNIVTNQSIPVKFNSRGDSYTDGKTVVISSRVTEPKDFDVAVGLALHEGSHIKLSDFSILQNLSSLIPDFIKETAITKGILNPVTVIKNLTNYIEDRRIDQYVFSSAPGYRDYYRSMYDKYFNDKLIDKALLSGEYTELEIDSYMFRIINLHNKNTQLSALPGLREIYKLIDLKNISRLKDSQDSLTTAISVFKVILNNIPVPQEQPNSSENGEPQQGDGGSGVQSGEDTQQMDQSTNGEQGGGDMSGMETQQSEGSDSPSNQTFTPTETLSDRQKELLPKKIEKQEKFIKGQIQKPALKKSDIKEIEAIDESGSEIINVAPEIGSYYGTPKKGFDVIVVKKLTRGLLDTKMFPMTHIGYNCDENGNWSYSLATPSQEAVEDGIRLGTLLGKKLQIRADERTTIFNRQKVGKLDRRMIASLGFGNEHIFEFRDVDKYNRTNLHISVDASSSMNGERWNKAMTNTVALARACDMVSNLDIQITFRTTQNDKPYVVMAYDSRKDKFSKIKQLFPYLHPSGTTPESLCYEAIIKEFVPSGNEVDSFFLNLSDGEPFFRETGLYYGGDVAVKHTQKMMKHFDTLGIRTLSYFVSEYGNVPPIFSEMYGKAARFIDVTNLNQVSKTMNQLFLEK